MRKITVSENMASFDNLIKAFNTKGYTKIGILAGKNARSSKGKDKLGNASIGVIQEFGSKSKKIPARSFLRMPLQTKSKDIVKGIMKRKDKIEGEIAKGNINYFLESLGIMAESVIQMAFSTRGFGKWAPNKTSTIKRKGSSSPLIDSSQLRRSIMSKVMKYGK